MGEEAEESPLVSVVVPTYGRPDHLPAALESVTAQTYDNVELLVVDDGSPEPVTATLPELSLDELTAVTFLRHRTNRGANAARNTGIRAARGEYVAFLDDDDRWAPEKLARQVERFQSADPAVGVVYTGKRTEGPEGTTTTEPSATGDVMGALLLGAEFGQFSSIMVAADAIEAAGLPDERLPAWQDREWLFRLAKECEFAAVSEPLTHRRVGLADRITRDFERKRDEAYPLFVSKHYEYAREYGLYHARAFLASLRLLVGRSAVRIGDYRAARRQFLSAFLANPFYRPVHPHLLASLGGRWSYETATTLRRLVRRLRDE